MPPWLREKGVFHTGTHRSRADVWLRRHSAVMGTGPAEPLVPFKATEPWAFQPGKYGES